LGTLRVVSAGDSGPMNIRSSHPTTAMSQGTFKPYQAEAPKASTAMVSLFIPRTILISTVKVS